jgi:RNA polymerase sigma-70 factor (ECF subfamily)
LAGRSVESTSKQVTTAVVTLRAHSFEAPGLEADVALAAGGDAAAFERLYRTHVAKVHSLARRMLGRHEADEVTQDVFVRTWQKLGTFRGDAAFTTWLHRLTVNVVIERRRSYAIQRERLSDDESAIERAAVIPPGRGDLTVDFEAAMASLPDGAREIFVLHDVEGYKHKEIGTLLGISPGTSKAQLHRARMMLRKHLGHARPGIG